MIRAWIRIPFTRHPATSLADLVVQEPCPALIVRPVHHECMRMRKELEALRVHCESRDGAATEMAPEPYIGPRGHQAVRDVGRVKPFIIPDDSDRVFTERVLYDNINPSWNIEPITATPSRCPSVLT